MTSAAAFQDSTRFKILAGIMFVVACDGACSLLLPQFAQVKYLIFLAILVVAAATFSINLTITTVPGYTFGFLALAMMALIETASSQGEAGRISYSSALFPMLLVGLAAFVPERQSRLDFDRMLRFFEAIAVAFAVGHVAAQIVFVFWQFAAEDWFDMTIHENSFFAVFALCLVVLRKRWRLAALLAVLIAISLAMRPSSTFIAGLAVGLGVAFAFLMDWRRAALLGGTGLLVGLMLFPPVFVAFPDFADLVYGIEPLVKEGVLGGQSNNSFRMVVLGLAREEILKTPLLIGQGFSGTTNVTVDLVIDGWQGAADSWANLATASQAPVHSDFMIMLWQGGVLGYGVFAISLLGTIGCIGRSLRITEAVGATKATALLRALFILIVVFGVFISFNPILQKHSFAYLFWFSVLIATFAYREVRTWQLPAARLASV